MCIRDSNNDVQCNLDISEKREYAESTYLALCQIFANFSAYFGISAALNILCSIFRFNIRCWVAVNVLNNGYSIKNVPWQINKEYVIMAYFRIFLPHILPCYGPHILKKISVLFLHT